LGEINQATLDNLGSRSIELSISVPEVHSPFPEGFATLNDICPSWKTQIGFINHGLEILGEKGTELGAVITTSFRNELATDNPNRIWSKRLSPFRCQQEPSFEQN
jgi:hypothetical protein